MAGPSIWPVIQLSGTGVDVGDGVFVAGTKTMKGGNSGVGVVVVQAASQITKGIMNNIFLCFIADSLYKKTGMVEGFNPKRGCENDPQAGDK